MKTRTFSARRSIALALAVALPLIGAAAQAEPLSRAQVQADTAVWFAAGMDKYSRNGANEMVDTQQYRDDLAVYSALRASPQFSTLVRDYQNGQSVHVSVTRDPLRVSIAGR